MQLTEWILALAGTVMTVFCAAHGFRAFVARDIPAACTAAVGGLLVSTVAVRPALLAELTEKLQEQVFGEIASHGTPPAHDTSRPTASGGTFSLPWVTIGLTLCGIAAAAALVLAGAAIAAAVRRRRVRTRLRHGLEARHDSVLEAYGDFHVNLLDNLNRLALADVNVPHTARLIDALDTARDARIPTAPESREAYRKAVTALEIAWKAADHHARAKGADYLPEDDRRSIKQAQAALAVALDERGYPPQRQLALRRAIRLIETVLPVPREAIAALETTTRLALDKA